MFKKLGVVGNLTILAIFSFFLISTAQASDSRDCSNKGDSFNCVEYLSTYDGDTIRVNIPRVHKLIGFNVKVRVRGIDAAEIRTHDMCERKAALKAKDEVKRIMNKAKTIELRNVSRGAFFRIIADVYVNGRSLGNHLLRESFVVEYQKGDVEIDWCNL